MYPEIEKVDGEIVYKDTDAIYVKNDEEVLQDIFNLMFNDEGEVDPVFRDAPPEWYDDDDEGDDDDDDE